MDLFRADQMRDYARQCITTLKAENARLKAAIEDAERCELKAVDRYEAAQSQAAAMAGLLEEAGKWIGEWCMEGDTPRHKCCPKGCEQNALWRKLDAALAAWKGKA